MGIPEKVVEEVVTEASERLGKDPNYSAMMVGEFVQGQPSITQYLGSKADDLGGADAVVNTVFHAALMAHCFVREYYRSISPISFDVLSAAAEGDRVEKLKGVQPALLDYLDANVEHPEMKKVLMLFALAMEELR